MSAGTCKCGRPVHVRKTGECHPCYNARKHIEHADAIEARRRARRESILGSPCSACGREPVAVVATRLCLNCAPRKPPSKRTNEASGQAVPRPRALSYQAAHLRLRANRGPASRWRCIACGEPAEQWAYRAGSEREITGEAPYQKNGRRRSRHLAWSPDPADYDPMCRPCHAARDGRKHVKGNVGSWKDPEYVRAWRRAYRERNAERRRTQSRESWRRVMADPAKRAARNQRRRQWRAAQRARGRSESP